MTEGDSIETETNERGTAWDLGCLRTIDRGCNLARSGVVVVSLARRMDDAYELAAEMIVKTLGPLESQSTPIIVKKRLIAYLETKLTLFVFFQEIFGLFAYALDALLSYSLLDTACTWSLCDTE